jgi:hypothetical protein
MLLGTIRVDPKTHAWALAHGAGPSCASWPERLAAKILTARGLKLSQIWASPVNSESFAHALHDTAPRGMAREACGWANVHLAGGRTCRGSARHRTRLAPPPPPPAPPPVPRRPPRDPPPAPPRAPLAAASRARASCRPRRPASPPPRPRPAPPSAAAAPAECTPRRSRGAPAPPTRRRRGPRCAISSFSTSPLWCVRAMGVRIMGAPAARRTRVAAEDHHGARARRRGGRRRRRHGLARAVTSLSCPLLYLIRDSPYRTNGGHGS